MDKKNNKKHNISSTSNIPNIPTEIRYDRFNIPHEWNETVASQNIIDETNRLYTFHLIEQMAGVGLSFPLENRYHQIAPQNASSLQALASQFVLSPQRRWVHEQAQNVDLDSLNCITFQQLLYGLFQEGGVTWERVLVLFYFCTDLSIRALREKFVGYFIKVYNWTMSYISRRLSVWIEEEGGWDIVLQTSVNNARNLSIIGVCCITLFVICIYIRSRK